MKNIRLTILAALLLAAPSAVQAQVAATAPGADTGAVTNAPAAPTTTANEGIPAETAAVSSETTETTETTSLGNTGGAPLLMTLGGMSLAMGAYFLRRRVSN